MTAVVFTDYVLGKLDENRRVEFPGAPSRLGVWVGREGVNKDTGE